MASSPMVRMAPLCFAGLLLLVGGCTGAESFCRQALEGYESTKGSGAMEQDEAHDRLLEVAAKHGTHSSAACARVLQLATAVNKGPVAGTGGSAPTAGGKAPGGRAETPPVGHDWRHGGRPLDRSRACYRSCADSYRQQRQSCFLRCGCPPRGSNTYRPGRRISYRCQTRESARCLKECRRALRPTYQDCRRGCRA